MKECYLDSYEFFVGKEEAYKDMKEVIDASYHTNWIEEDIYTSINKYITSCIERAKDNQERILDDMRRHSL